MSKNKEDENKTSYGLSMGTTSSFHKRHIWEDIADELGGEFKYKHTIDKVYEMHEVKIPHLNWTIHITASDVRPVRFEIEFTAIANFEFSLTWEDFIDSIIKKFGKPEIQMGWKEFDDRYLIKSNRSDLLKEVLKVDIQKLLLEHNIYSVHYTTEKKDHASKLTSTIQRQSGKKEDMLKVIALFKRLMDELSKAKIIRS